MLSNSDLYGWIGDEGGVESLIRHGVGENEFADVKAGILWHKAVEAFELFRRASDELMEYLEENSEDADVEEIDD